MLGADGGTIADLSLDGLRSLVGGGGATAGMIAKLSACRSAVESGAREVFIADGRDGSALAVLARYGRAAGAAVGTRIVAGTRMKRSAAKRTKAS